MRHRPFAPPPALAGSLTPIHPPDHPRRPSHDSGDFSVLDRSVSGVYEHCPDCATSLDCLYKRISTESASSSSASSDDNSVEDDARPMFFFHDPERTGPAENDSFVFADNWQV